jgi:peptide/nickel transport system permease protein
VFSGNRSGAAADRGLRTRPWLRFIARRLTRFVLSLLLVASACFAMIHAVGGDPVRASLGTTAPQALVDAKRQALGLDQPLWVQYRNFLQHAATGDFGVSLDSGLPVSEVITDRWSSTASLAGLAFLVAGVVSVPTGLAAGVMAYRGRRSGLDLGFSTITGALTATPEFLLAVGLVFVFAVSLHMAPVAGRSGPGSYVLPVTALALAPAAALARLVRVDTMRVLGEDYLRTARAKRLPARLVYFRHALPNLLTATLTVAGMTLSGLLAGTVLVENVFAWPGLGTVLVSSIISRDYPVVQGLGVLFGAAVLVVNLLVDICLLLLSPTTTLREH